MISFRFHLVSITAVFLGIAIGVVVGSTFVDRAIVDGLEDRISTVSRTLDRRRAENSALQAETDRLDEYGEAGAPFAVSGRLEGVPTLFIAVRGTDDEAVRDLVTLAQQAGATAPGIVWLEPQWALADADQIADLAELADVASGTADRVRARVMAAAVEELVADGDATTTTVPPAAPIPVLEAVTGSGFLSFEPVGEDSELAILGGAGVSVIAVTGPRAEPELLPMLAPVVDALRDAGLPTLVAEYFVEPDENQSDPPERGATALAAVPEEHAASISTVDDLDRREGLVAAVLALSDLQDDIVGRYGYGDGVAGPLPAWTPLG